MLRLHTHHEKCAGHDAFHAPQRVIYPNIHSSHYSILEIGQADVSIEQRVLQLLPVALPR